MTQNGIGIDYHDPLSGWIEFVLNDTLELKDVYMYPKQAQQDRDTRYRVVFINRAPRTEHKQVLDKERIEFEVWYSSFDVQDIKSKRIIQLEKDLENSKREAESYKQVYSDAWSELVKLRAEKERRSIRVA